VETDQIAEYKERERQRASDLLARAEKSPKIAILDFYPEYNWLNDTLYSADLPTRFSAIDPRLRTIPVWVTLPFSGVIVVGLEPWADRDIFRECYGLEVEQFVDLIDKKKLAVRLNNPLEFYDGLHYLDPILEKNPPSLARNEAFSIALLGQQRLDRIRDETDKIVRGMAAKPLHFAAKWRMPEKTFVKASITLFERLHTLGYSNYVDSLVSESRGDFESLISQVRLYYLSLAAPIFRSLEGIHALPRDSLAAYPAPIKERFPVDVGRFLVKKLQLVRPRTFEQALEIYPDYEKARRSLFRLDKLLGQIPSVSDLEDRTSELERSWNEVLGTVRRAEQAAAITKGIGVVGSIASSALSPWVGLPGILASLGFRGLAVDRVAKAVGHAVAKLGKPSHIVEVYDFGEEVTKWKERTSWPR